jgi:hypothetical protein
MTITLKYIGTQDRWPELPVTGKPSNWLLGQVDSRADSEASALLSTGLFENLSDDQITSDQASSILSGPRVACQLGYIARGTNFAYTNPNAAGATPTVVLPRTNTSYSSSDVVLPARVGDLIEFMFSGRINVDATNGLTLSVWSVGNTYRDLSSGVTGLQSVAGFLTAAAASTLTHKASVFYVVQHSDIDANGMIVLRLYGANSTGAVSATHTFVAAASGGPTNFVLGKNLRNNKAGQVQVALQYPGGVKGQNLAFSTTGAAFGALSSVDATGATDIVMPAQALDVIQFDLVGRYTAATNMRWCVWIMKNGTAFKNAHTTGVVFNTDGPILDSNSGTQSIGAVSAFRVRDVDLVNGTLTLRLYCVNTSGSGAQNHTLLGSDNVGGYTYLRATNYGSAWRYAVTPTLTWEGGNDTSGGSLQESSVWFDGGKWNIIYTAVKNGYLGWAWTNGPTLRNATWSKNANPILGNGVGGVAGVCNRPSVLFENGTVYVFFRGLPGGGIGCAYGASPSALTVVTALASAPSGYTTLENSKVIRGADGAYWMWFEGLHTVTGKWQIGLAKSTTPQGPYTHVAAPLTSLQVIATGTANSPDVAYTGAGYRIVHHGTPNTSLSVPSLPYLADSVDGQNWVRRGLGADGTANGLVMPFTDIVGQQLADPSCEVENGLAYLFLSQVINTSPEQGGIVVNDPVAWPIDYGA